jgi:hypothetical protein
MTQPESRLSGKIISMINRRGGYVWKVHGNEFTPAGTPDIVGTYRAYFIALETKMPGNDLSVRQRYVISKMRRAGGFVCAPCKSIEEAEVMLIHMDSWLDGLQQVRIAAAYVLEDLYGRGAS